MWIFELDKQDHQRCRSQAEPSQMNCKTILRHCRETFSDIVPRHLPVDHSIAEYLGQSHFKNSLQKLKNPMYYAKANVLAGGPDCNGNQVASPPPPRKN